MQCDGDLENTSLQSKLICAFLMIQISHVLPKASGLENLTRFRLDLNVDEAAARVHIKGQTKQTPGRIITLHHGTFFLSPTEDADDDNNRS